VIAIVLAVLLIDAGQRGPYAQPGEPAPVRVGCDPGTTGVATDGAATERRVALTFDDGPSSYTPRILRALRRADAPATFFVVGMQLGGREGMLRRMLRDGHEIGNHSMMHSPGPSREDLSEASATIEAATGFRPCRFRPPGGEVDDQLVRDAEALGMTTVLWNVDPGDWRLQEPSEMLALTLDAVEPGSIVLLHDGGGDRTATAEMVPQLIDGLRKRGFELVTVTRLLGGRFTVAE
jgi:peptidoglycan/xylan/chitin deacetylase (PgdA/CDA1 family)